MTTADRSSLQRSPAPRLSAGSNHFVARPGPKRVSYPEYQKKSVLGAVRITVQLSRAGKATRERRGGVGCSRMLCRSFRVELLLGDLEKQPKRCIHGC